MTGPSLQVSPVPDADVPCLRLVGELDLDSSAQLRSALADWLARPSHRVILDLRELRFCDCAGFNALLEAKATADGTGTELSVEGARAQVARLFSLIGADELFAASVPGPRPGTR
jgi:anti-anti-sigma factor